MRLERVEMTMASCGCSSWPVSAVKNTWVSCRYRTPRAYSHMLPGMGSEAADAMGEALG